MADGAIERIVVFASGQGTGFDALVADRKQNRLKIPLAALVCDRPQAPVIAKAQAQGVPVIVVPVPRTKNARLAHEAMIIEQLEALLTPQILWSSSTWLVLAGYMRLFSPQFIEKFPGIRGAPSRIVNIHPSLLPDFKGAHGYEDAFRAGAKQMGCTIHYVTAAMDEGPIIGQWRFDVTDGEDLASIRARGQKLEHDVYGATIQRIAEGSTAQESKSEGGKMPVVNATSVSRYEWAYVNDDVDAESRALEANLKVFFPQWAPFKPRLTLSQIFYIKNEQPETELALSELLKDPFRNLIKNKLSPPPNGSTSGQLWHIEKTFAPGVTDNVAQVLTEGLAQLGQSPQGLQVRSGWGLWIELPNDLVNDLGKNPVDIRASVERYANTVFHNELIEKVLISGPLKPENLQTDQRSGDVIVNQVLAQLVERCFIESKNKSVKESYNTVPLSGLTLVQLQKLSDDRLWALTADEMQVVQNHYKTLGREPTDVEMEIIAQTWSEHCKHKIFAARIQVDDVRKNDRYEVQSLFKTFIRGSTEKINSSFLQSIFIDNAGVIAINDRWNAAIKVETHNSPSALDPYGGALTGIVGVNRDILGVGLGAEPVANLDVFCVGPLDAPEELPPRLHHPRRILEGVRLGVEHGGNKSGIPTVTGAVVHHPGFLGKPLVFCGTVGLMPRAPDAPRALLDKKICNNDYVVMIGGAIGKDGIHGATFSSLELSESSPVSAVQLGDPLTQRRVWDFLIEARDRKLFRAVTDNGAGGLSSSVGELATLCGERGGADIDVSLAKTKYAGLMAFELIVSESQERMSLAVAPESLDEFLDLAQRRGVVCSVLGQFKDDGYFRVRYQGQVVGELSMEFLHDGLPTMQLSARVTKPDETHKNRYGVWASLSPVVQKDVAKALLAILAHPNVCSRRSIVQRYDHEVQGRTVRKPYGTAQHAAPNDGAVIRLDAHSTEGVALGLGLRPDVAPYDAALAADLALDEAIRNVVAAGGDPEHTALVDNFCWPDPLPPRSSASATDVLDAEKRLGDLVVSCQRLYLGAVAHGMPFVSGKDSMKNDYRMGDVKISVPPTVLVTAMAKVPHVGRVPRGQIMAEHFAGQFSEQSTLKLLWVAATAPAVNEHGYPSVDLNRAPKFYRALSRLIAEGHVLVAHDVSEGGFLAATAEVMMGAPASVVIDLHKNPAKNHTENFTEQSLVISPFFEAPSAFVLVVTEKAAKSIEAALDAYWCQRVGEVTHQSQTDRRILKYSTGSECFQWAVTDLERAYHGVDDCGIQGALPAEPNQIDSNEFAPSQMIVSHHIAKAPHHGPRALILTGDGLNCHRETLQAAELAGFQGCIVHLNDFLRSAGETKKYLDSYPFLAIPGGFSFGDELGSGRVLALKLKNAMGNLFENYLKKGGLVLGICNGFQTLALMDVFGEGIRLGHNKGAASGFINRWVALKVVGQGPFFSKIKSHYKNGALNMELPIRHGEGRLVAADPKLIEALVQNAQVAAHYQEDINGSTQLIAGLTAYGGQVLGMMPHPEAYWSPELHPWGSNRNVPLGTVFFEGAYHALKS